MPSDLESEHKLTLTPAASGLRHVSKQLLNGAERLDRSSDVWNEALAQEVERNARRRKEVGNTAGELAAPQELKDVPIPLASDARKRCAIKAATAVASSQMQSSSAVADTPVQQNSMADESRMDVEG